MSRLSRSNKLKKDAFVGRRSFLKSSVVGGLSSQVVLGAHLTALGAPESTCRFRVSAVEALGLFTDLLFRIQAGSLSMVTKKIERVAVDCQDQFKKICASVEQLESQLQNNKNPQVERMKVLAEIGCAGADLATTTPPEGTKALLRSLDTVNREIALAAQELLPERETVLTPAATLTLRAIVVQVNESAAIRSRIGDARDSTRESTDLIVKGVQSIQRLIFEASSQILVADEGKSTESQAARRRATELLSQTRDSLKQLIDALKTKQLYAEESPGDFLLLVLDGTKQWVQDPASVGASPTISNLRGEVTFVHIVLSAPPPPAMPFSGFDGDEVNRLLRKYCPPDGAIHQAQVITAMTAVVGWKVAKAFFGSPPSYSDLLDAVRSALNVLHLSCRAYEDRVPNPEMLAQKLTRMIMA